jgi:ubiquinone biosynthesis protein
MLPPELIPTPLRAPGKRSQVEIRPTELRRRSGHWRFFSTVASWLAGNLWLRVRRRYTPQESARRLRLLIEDMGALWIKVGQLVSLRTDFLSPAVADELGKLQFRTIGFPPSEARDIIRRELGRDPDEVFDEFDEMPFAAASICQVHKARLRDSGLPVAVKVQRPYVDLDLERDFRLIEQLLGLLIRFEILPHLKWDSLLWELRQVLREEVDYRYEAANLRRMRKSLKKHDIYVPRVYEELSTRRVLVMEFVPGVLMSDYVEALRNDRPRLAAWLQENNVDPEKVGTRIFRSFFRQLMEDNLFHSDLHPGNVMFLRDSRVCLIDFGSIGSNDVNFLRLYALNMAAVGRRDYQKAIDYTFLLCEELPYINVAPLKTEVTRCYRDWDAKLALDNVPYHERSIASVGGASGKVLIEHKVAASWQFLKISRTWTTLDAALSFLVPDANYVKLIGGYFREASERNKERLRQLGASGIAVRSFSEFAEAGMFQGAAVRRKLQGFEGLIGRAADAGAMFMRGLSWLAFLGFATALWVVSRWARVGGESPLVAPYVWELLIPFFALAFFRLRRIAARLMTAEVRLS